jgi:biopolymer transport protein ExbD
MSQVNTDNTSLTPDHDVVHHQSPRSKREVAPANMQVNLTSMIDVIFQLLIYFVLTASFALGEGVITAKVPAGSGQTAAKPPQQELNIILSPAGANGVRITVEHQATAPRDFEELTLMLKMLQNNDTNSAGVVPDDAPVQIKPAERVRWAHVVNAFNSAVSAKYKSVSFVPPQQ